MLPIGMVIEVWMRKHKDTYQYRGMVRNGDRYVYRGEWIASQKAAAAVAEQQARRLHDKGKYSVRAQRSPSAIAAAVRRPRDSNVSDGSAGVNPDCSG